MSEPQQDAPEAGAAQQAGQTPQTPPWGDDFDPERAWNTIQKLREREKELEKQPRLTPEQKKQLTEYQQQIEASKTDAQRKDEELSRLQAESQKWRTATVTSRIEALAASDFAFPSDAVDKLKPEKYLGDDGSIDEKAIKADLAKLLEQRPNYRADRRDPRVPAPNYAQGTSGRPAPASVSDHMNNLIRSARV